MEFKSVDFAYPTRESVRILHDFSLHVPADTTTALVGSSGCGKSTALALLLRFYECSAGTVSFDGVDVKALNASWLRSRMAFVQQEPILFGMTVGENVRYGITARGAASTDMARQSADGAGSPMHERVEAACRLANAHTFISDFSEGYDTVVGERGVRLSGGQKQRIAIARALLVEPRVLLLDEATSALDSESERLVQEAIDRASSGRTVIVVAHRLSTVQDAQQIAMVSKGSVVDAGTHKDLLGRCEAYAKLVRRQLGAGASDTALESLTRRI